jgi:hypothetical protein
MAAAFVLTILLLTGLTRRPPENIWAIDDLEAGIVMADVILTETPTAILTMTVVTVGPSVIGTLMAGTEETGENVAAPLPAVADTLRSTVGEDLTQKAP